MSSEAHINGGAPHAEPDEDRLPVLAAEARPLDRPAGEVLPAPAVAATGGFLAGMAALVLVRFLRRSAQRPRRGVGIRRTKGGDRALEIAGSRSFLVDVHILKR